MRRLLALLVVVAGPVVFLARRRTRRRERVHLFYDDGSMVTVERSRPESARLLTLAHEAL